MAFLDTVFLFIFFPLFLAVYFVVPKRGKNAVLAVASGAVYFWVSPLCFVVSAAVMIFTYFISAIVSKKSNKYLKDGTFIASVSIYVIVFLLFLYLKWQSLRLFGSTLKINPVGLNFFILSNISYMSDIYKNKCKRQTSFIGLFVYLIMFPKLLAGPVVKYRDFQDQIQNRTISKYKLVSGIKLFVRGMAKKVILADSVWPLYLSVVSIGPGNISVVTAWLGAAAAVFSIYFDFSGYIDMARGIGSLLGFSLPVNFKSPFSAFSIHDFFARWNTTLIGWFDCYVVENLKLKKGVYPYFKSLIIAFLYAVFVGCGFSGLISAAYFSILLVLETAYFNKKMLKIPKAYRSVITFLLVCAGAVLFVSNSVYDGIRYLGDMFFINGRFVDGSSIYYLTSYFVFLVLCVFSGNTVIKRRATKIKRRHVKSYRICLEIAYIILFVISICYMVSNPGSSFLCLT